MGRQLFLIQGPVRPREGKTKCSAIGQVPIIRTQRAYQLRGAEVEKGGLQGRSKDPEFGEIGIEL